MDYQKQIASFVPQSKQEASDKAIILDLVGQYPQNILLRENQSAHITSSGLIMNPALDKVLMVHHNIYKTWTWTGGHADGDGDLLRVALKEAREETGIAQVQAFCPELLSLDILPVFGHYKKGRYVSAHLHLSTAFLLIAWEVQPLKVRQEENSGVQWVAWDQVAQYSKEPFMIEIYHKMLARAQDGVEALSGKVGQGC